jgi:hypothetical protein
MERFSLLVLAIFLFLSCKKDEEIQLESDYHQIQLFLDAPLPALDNHQSPATTIQDELGFHPRDSARLSFYSLFIQDELRERSITNNLNLEQTTQLSVDSIQGDFNIYSSYNDAIENILLPYYYLYSSYQAASDEENINLVFQNNKFCFISVKSLGPLLNSVQIEGNPLFEVSEGLYYAFLDVEEQPFDLVIQSGASQIIEVLDDLEIDNQYLYEVSMEEQEALISLSYILGFDGEIINKELLINSSENINLILNGGFESWLDNSTPLDFDMYENASKDSLIVFDGDYALRQTYGTSALSQQIPIEAMENYEISFYYQVIEGDGSDARLWGSFMDVELNHIEDIRNIGSTYFTANPGDGLWHRYIEEYQAPDQAEVMNFELRVYGEAVVVFDSISIKKAQ